MGPGVPPCPGVPPGVAPWGPPWVPPGALPGPPGEPYFALGGVLPGPSLGPPWGSLWGSFWLLWRPLASLLACQGASWSQFKQVETPKPHFATISDRIP